jgi:protein-S-isoprenylcysteine O-methyltransferase Ste14
MTIFSWLVFALWLALLAYWVLSATAVTRSTGCRWIWWREIAMRLGFFALVVLAVRIAVASGVLPNAGLYAFNSSMILGLIGFVCALLGGGLAIAARACLGRNWGGPTTNEKDAELVTTGPYALVRHPLYSGLLFAILGSAIGQSVLWLLPLIVYGPYFIQGARREEKLLIDRFPDRYPAYMKRTKMLLPFVL